LPESDEGEFKGKTSMLVGEPLILIRTRDPASVPLVKDLCLQQPTGFTIGQSLLREADAVVFHIPEWFYGCPTFEETPKFHGQLWIAYSMESRVNYKQLANQRFMRHFDLCMTYEQDADIWTPYLPGHSTWLSIQRSSIAEKTESHPAALFRSDPVDQSGRNAFVAALMRYTMVDSYGKFLNNRTIAGPDMGWNTKLKVISRYHFYLALENSIAPDYVTEKIFDAFRAGTVPIYLGAPNVREFVPECSYIDATRFDGPKSLANYLHHLVQNPTDYAAYFDWRQKPLPPTLLEKTARIEVEPLVQLQRIVAKARKERRRRYCEIPHYPFGLFSAIKAQLRPLKDRLRKLRRHD
jgi:hypothetical protein